MFRPAATALLAFCLAASSWAQVQRNFPQNAMRGKMAFGEAPQIMLNGDLARLAPGARIRDNSNLIIVPSTIAGARFVVNYTVDLGGQVKDVWILTPAEVDKSPWPTSADQLRSWSFDPVAQVWTKP